jgi:riboflavin synthase
MEGGCMFTGIIEEIGTVRRIGSGRIHIRAKTVLEGVKIGDSIAVNGVCLTVTELGADFFAADVMPETFQRSSLGKLKTGSGVNLERAMAADGRFGGHIVSGHIDGTGKIQSITKDGNAVRYRIDTSKELLRGIVEKGSVAVDGISLTVAAVASDWFELSVIPHTLHETVLEKKRIGEIVNLENDMIGKYVERLLSLNQEEEKKPSALTKEFLLRAGF